MSLSQIELVWVRVRVEGECFWVNLREENKVSEFHNAEAESKMAEFKMAEFKMATIIKWHQNEWVWVNEWEFLTRQVKVSWIQDGSGMASVCHHQVEWMSDVFCEEMKPSWGIQDGWIQHGSVVWIQDGRIQDGCHHQVRMNEFESEWISLSQSQSGGRVFLSESERR